MELPGRSLAEEDAFVSRLLDAPPEAVTEAIEAAMAAKRPQLAARLVVLLPELSGTIEAARKAARWLLVDGQAPPDDATAGLDEAWAEIRRRRVRRTKHRTRRSPRGPGLDGE